MPVINHFDILAPLYNRLFKLRDAEKLKEIAALPASGTLLDVGGGTGRIGKPLAQWIDRVVIADLSFAMLQQVGLQPNIFAGCMQSEALAFPSEWFDRVIIVDALHHVWRASDTCAELWRVVKPGGQIVIEEPDIASFSVKVLSVVEKLLLMRSFFIQPEKIAAFFNYANAEVNILRSGYTAWIVIKKS